MPTRPRRAALLFVAVFALTAAAGCSSGPPPVTSHGTLTLEANPLGGTQVAQAFPDITDGSQVTVKDSSGAVIGTGTLSLDTKMTEAEAGVIAVTMGVASEASLMQAYVAVYNFTVSGLPGGESRYGFSVGSGHGTIWESPAQVKDPQLSLGSLSS